MKGVLHVLGVIFSGLMRLLACGLVTLGLVGCGVGPMQLPPVPEPVPVPLRTSGNPTASIVLDRIVATMRSGTTIGHLPKGGLVFNDSLCNTYRSNRILTWSGGNALIGDWRGEFGAVFFATMERTGFNVVGDPNKLFDAGRDAAAADLKIGARLVEIKSNICESSHWFNGAPRGEYTGEAYLRLEWVVYSNRDRREVLTLTTEGRYEHKERSRSLMPVYLGAFERATEAMTGNVKLRDLVQQHNQPATGGLTPTAEQGEALRLPGLRENSQGISQNREAVLAAVVTIRVGSGHGSGFAISPDGYILTNSHVVTGAGSVLVRFNNGLDVEGQVLRHDPVRDVALIKVPVRLSHVLPIRKSGAETLEQVFAIGSPVDESLQSSVTRGIVSAVRIEEQSRLPVIQADVAVSTGNSGGPLVDDRGNVVGITMASIVDAQNLNLFIPINSALERLNVSVSATPDG